MKSFTTFAVAALGCYYLADSALGQVTPAPVTPTTPTTPATTPATPTPATPTPGTPTTPTTPATPGTPTPGQPTPATTPTPTPTPTTTPTPTPTPAPQGQQPVTTPAVTPPTPFTPPVPAGPVPPPLPGPMPIEGTPWTEENPMPYPLYDVGCALHEGKVYIMGNSDTDEGTAATVVFDPATGGYEEAPAYPRPGGGHFVASAEGALWVIGGFTGSGNSGLGGSAQYLGPDPNNPQNPPPYFWNTNIQTGEKNVGLAAAGIINGNAHICGGWDDTAKGTAVECSIFSFANAFTGDPWTAGPSLETGVHKPCFGSDGSTLYIAGGRTKAIGKFDALSVTETVQYYTPGKVTVGPAVIPEPRSGYISAFVDGQLICMGGEIQGNFTADIADPRGFDATTNSYQRVDVYDTVTESWSEGTDLPVGVHSGCAVVDGDTVYVIGGRFVAGGDKGTGSNKIYSIATSDLLAGTAFAPAPTPTPEPTVDVAGPTPTPMPAPTMGPGPMPEPMPAGPMPAEPPASMPAAPMPAAPMAMGPGPDAPAPVSDREGDDLIIPGAGPAEGPEEVMPPAEADDTAEPPTEEDEPSEEPAEEAEPTAEEPESSLGLGDGDGPTAAQTDDDDVEAAEEPDSAAAGVSLAATAVAAAFAVILA